MSRTIVLSCAAALLLTAACGGSSDPDLAPVAASALSRAVPGDHATIQAALDAAAPGDVVAVAAGAWNEDLVLPAGVTLAGAGRDDTVIFGAVSATEVDGVAIRDLTLDGSLSNGGGVAGLTFSGAGFMLERVTIKGFAAGISAATDVTAAASTVDAAWIEGSTSSGLLIQGDGTLTVTNSVFAYHPGDAVRLLAAAGQGAVVLANNLVFASGFGLADGAAFRMEASDGFLLSNNIAVSNQVGIYCAGTCDNDHNLVWGNTQSWDGVAAAGPGTLSVDPRFAGPGEGDFSLLFDSPCVDAGSLVWAPPADHIGTPRPLGGGVDIGPYERVADDPNASIVITEIMANPTSETTGEYVELHNVGVAAVDVAGWVIDDGDATDLLVGYGGGPTAIPAGGWAVILDPDYAGDYDIPAEAILLTVADSPNLGSGLAISDPVRLLLAGGVVPVDTYSYPFDPGNGLAVEKSELADGDAASNWVISPCGATPGAPNCASLPSDVSKQVLIAIHEVMANPLDEKTGEFIELLNFGPDPIDVGGWVLSDGDATDTLASWDGGTTVLEPGAYAIVLDPDYAGQYDIPATTILLTVGSSGTLGNGLANNDPIALLNATGLVVVDTYTHTLNAGNGTSVEKVAANIGDIASNYVASTCATGSSPGMANCVTEGGASPVSGATISIMEVMANPLDEDTGEYVELLNYGSEPIDLAGFRLNDGDQEEALGPFEAGGPTVLGPGGRAVVLDSEYAGQYSIPDTALLLRTPDTSVGSGLSTNDPITLRAPKGAKVLDSFLFPFNPGNGVSAEKIALVVGDVPQNWTASPCKASPGAANCAAGGPGPEVTVSATGVVISEVMANPLSEGTGEYVELYNSGPVGVDVAGWWLDDGDALDQLEAFVPGGSTIIPAGGFAVVLDRDYAGDYTLPAGVVRLTVSDKTLGNGLTTSDPVALFEADGATQVSSFCFPFNPGNGRSVEKVTLTGPDAQDGWQASTCAKTLGDLNDDASPGERNCVDPYGDVTGTKAPGQPCPQGAAECLTGLCGIQLSSGNTFCTESCAVGGDTCPAGFECVAIADEDYDAICVPPESGGAPALVINEIAYDGPGTDVDVYVELYGTPGAIVDGLQLVGINGSNGNDYATLNLTGVVGGDGFFVVAHPEASPAILAAADLVSTQVDFQNGPDTVQLRWSGALVDAVAYGDFDPDEVPAGEGAPAPDHGPGEALGRLPDGADSDDNAADFTVQALSPGAPNEAACDPAACPSGVCQDGACVQLPDPPDLSLLLTEVVVTPAAGELVEIYNAGAEEASLAGVWLADYAAYHGLPAGADEPSSSDFRVTFPPGATLAAGALLVVSLDSAADYEAEWGALPDYDLDEGDPGAPAMVGTATGSSGLTDGDEMVVLFYWDGVGPTVADLDYLVYGDTSDAADKTGVDGYQPDTAPADQLPAAAPGGGDSLNRCDLDETGEAQAGGNGLDGADETSEPFADTWQVLPATPGALADCSPTGPVPFEAMSGVVLPTAVTSVESLLLLTSDAEFEAQLGVPAPATLDFDTHWALLYSAGALPVPGHVASIHEIANLGGTLLVTTALQLPGADCNTLDLALPTWTLVALPHTGAAAPPVEQLHGEDELECAASGVAVGADCDDLTPCLPDAICAGAATWGSGLCFPAWMWGSFPGTGGAIPDADSAGLAAAVEVTGLASVPMDIIVYVEISHPSPSDLTVLLLDPPDPSSGEPQQAVLWDQEQVSGETLSLTSIVKAISTDEEANGTWTLVVIDHAAGASGTLDSWTLELTSRWD